MQSQKDFFKYHPKVNEFHFTSDGQAFFAKSDAEAHATSLQDKSVESVTRNDLSKKNKAIENAEADEKKEAEDEAKAKIVADAKAEAEKKQADEKASKK